MRRQFLTAVVIVIVINSLGALIYPQVLWSLVGFAPLIILGLFDMLQTRQAIRRNYPVVGHFRYLLESIRPEIQQYFIESETDGRPFGRDQRSLVYQRAKGDMDTVPFGSQLDMYDVGYEWVNHSMAPLHLAPQDMRILVGGPECTQPYSASLLNISAMSYGSLSTNAVLALNMGAKIGGFAHNTGEGGISPYHLEPGGDLVWQIGTGYFGCRTLDGNFDPGMYRERAALPQVKMIELKISQGAKPGHGGILPGKKVTPEIAAIRGVPLGKDVISPPAHSAFSTPIEMMVFIAQLRELGGGKPVGFKLCIGKRREFLALCKAMVQTGITPDFITVDGSEGGTGAAPLEFSNHVGAPLVESLIFAHNALVGYGLRAHIRLIASGKVASGFGMVKRLALGADMLNAARAMMLAIGCIQARKCNTNKCPVGVATQDPHLVVGLVPAEKSVRVANYHRETIESVAEIIGAMGINTPADLHPWHIMRRTSMTEIHHYGEIYEYLEPGALLAEPLPESYARACRVASPITFAHVSL